MPEGSSNPDSSPGAQDTDSINVAFWNLQNLFDTEASKLATDLEFTSVHGWDRAAFRAKITNLAEAIRAMFDGKGPDLLGICEIENERVARVLIEALGRSDYALAHVDHPDIHGIGTSLIYSTNHFEVNEEKTRGHQVHLRYPTRDVFEVHLKVRANQSNLVVMVNHWPSRKNGVQDSNPFRTTVASHCRELIDRNLKVTRKEYLKLNDDDASLQYLNNTWDRNILLMGDFNDEPWDRTIVEILNSGFSTHHMNDGVQFVRGNLPSYKAYASRAVPMFNPMWSLVSEPDTGTKHYDRPAQSMHLQDQFMLSRGLYLGLQGLQLTERSSGIPAVDIFRPEQIRNELGHPSEFLPEARRGYSDHFPITASIRLVDDILGDVES